MSLSRSLAAFALFGSILATPPALSQENTSVAAFRDWSVFNPSNPKECYIVSPPTKWEAQRGGSKVEVRRGDILLFVTIRPDDGVDKEVSYTGGYPFRPGGEIEVRISGNAFTLSPGSGDSGEWAWPPSPARDKAIVDAMKAGSSATITAVSSRGTTTVDEFSLLGFSAALEEAEKLCN